MKVRMMVILGACAVALGGGAWAWRTQAQRAEWSELRPVVPDPVGERAPGLDARLHACAQRLAGPTPDLAALEEFARVCHASGLLEPAAAAYRALARYDPSEARWPYSLATLEAGYGRLNEALPLLQRSTELAPEHVPAWLRLGAARLKADDPAGAAVAYGEALRRAPEDPFALVGLARCALREERWTAARGLLQRAVTADPRMAPAQHLLATVHARLGNEGTAETVLARSDAAAMEVEPSDSWLDDLYRFGHDIYRLRVLSASSLAAGHFDRALAICERARSLAPDDARVAWQFGRIFLRIGRLAEAREHLERAVALDPRDEKALQDLIGVLEQQGDAVALARHRAAFEHHFGTTPP